ncbi:MAG: hypothetical protein H6719_17380 [Sandaracinaceae bacterium]|nr:hypothetical protein [Sandaracinaceae bacterium]
MRAFALVLLVLVLPVPALADAVGPAPADCPSGAQGSTSHYGPNCAPDPCTSDADCAAAHNRPAGRTCGDAALCVETVTHEHWRGNTTVVTSHGPCGAGDTCERGECQRGRFCVGAPPTPPAPPPAEPDPEPAPEAASPPVEPAATDDGGCGVTRGPQPGLPALALAAVALAFARRRRRG